MSDKNLKKSWKMVLTHCSSHVIGVEETCDRVIINKMPAKDLRFCLSFAHGVHQNRDFFRYVSLKNALRGGLNDASSGFGLWAKTLWGQ